MCIYNTYIHRRMKNIIFQIMVLFTKTPKPCYTRMLNILLKFSVDIQMQEAFNNTEETSHYTHFINQGRKRPKTKLIISSSFWKNIITYIAYGQPFRCLQISWPIRGWFEETNLMRRSSVQ